MKADDPSARNPPPEPDSARETPEVEALLRYYRSRAVARRQRHTRMVIAALLGGGVLIAAALSVLPRARNGRVVMPAPSSATSAGPPARAAPEISPPSADSRAPGSNTLAVAKVTAPRQPAADAEPPKPIAVAVRPQPSERLTAIHIGDSKERVFDLFGSTVQHQKETVIRLDGMRLRATGRSPDHPKLEVADVEVGDNGKAQRYWFLFGEGYLIAWGRPDDWRSTASRLQLEMEYR
jgi:hypothetical protein